MRRIALVGMLVVLGLFVQPLHNTQASGFVPLYIGSDGFIHQRDSIGSIVKLYGYNQGGLFLGNAGVDKVKYGDPAANIAATQQKIIDTKHAFPMVNFVRIAYNAYWWNTDVYVPDAGMGFKQWLQDYVGWELSVGNYVSLDRATQFFEPPCGYDGVHPPVTFCPSQNQAEKDGNLAEKTDNMSTAEPAISSLSSLYSGNAGVLFEVWNEPTDAQIADEQTFFNDMNAMMNIVDQNDPGAVKIAYIHDYKDVQNKVYPDYPQQNIIIADHSYDGFNGYRLWDDQHCVEPGSNDFSPDLSLWQFIQSKGHAITIDEWGGCDDTEPYNSQLVSTVKHYQASMCYFSAQDLFNPDGTLNPNGTLVSSDYS